MAHDLSRWIEAAEARRLSEEAMSLQDYRLSEHQYVHLGDRYVLLTSRQRQSVGREVLSAIGLHAAAFMRRRS